MYRSAQNSDLEFIVAILLRFDSKTHQAYNIHAEESSVRETVRKIILDGICLVGTRSCAGAFISPYPWNYSQKIATVAFWYFESHRQIGIFKELMKRCRDSGATHISAASHFPKYTIQPYYEKLGLSPCELQSMSQL